MNLKYGEYCFKQNTRKAKSAGFHYDMITNMKEKIALKLINRLLEGPNPVSSTDLAFTLEVSEKTALKYLNSLKDILQDQGASIEIKQGMGSYIVIHDKELFDGFLRGLEHRDYLNDPEARQKYVLARLLTERDYINVYDLADDLYVSPSLLRGILRSLNPVIEKYYLKLDNSRTQGYMIRGDEKDIRSCLTKECKRDVSISDFLATSDMQEFDINGISQIVSDSLAKFNIAIGSEGVSQLTLHILIAVNRIETDHTIELDDAVLKSDLRSSVEFFVANMISNRLRELFGIQIPYNELLYLTMHINGKQRIYGHEKLQVKVDREALIFYNRFLRNILKLGNVDFFEDDELRTSLLNHIVPFLNRVQNDMQVVKTDLSNIKNEFPYAYELALFGLNELISKGNELSNAEISYFALHLALSLEKAKTTTLKLNIALICDEVSSIFQILSYKLKKNFDEYINTISFITPGNLDDYNPDDYQIILNTTSRKFQLDGEIIEISPSLDSKDIYNIREALSRQQTKDAVLSLINPNLFFRIDGENVDDVLEKQIDRIRQVMSLPEDFLQQVKIRESLESTEYDNRIAIPHPMHTENLPNFISIAILKHPILWKKKNVQLVFLICVHDRHDQTSQFFEKISKIICDDVVAKKLIHAQDFKEFIRIFLNV